MKKMMLWPLLLVLLTTGCWDYRGMNSINIVAGFAADKNPQTGLYQLTLEIVNMKAGDEGEDQSIYVQTEGVTIVDAMRNAQKKLVNKLFFGNMRTVMISQQIAQEEGILNTMDALLRDGEARETVNMIISQENTAREVLMAEGLDMRNTSFQISKIVEEDNRTVSATKQIQLYRAYEMIQKEGCALVLPAFIQGQNGATKVAEANGLALFKEDKLTGYLSPEEARHYLIAVGEAQGGIVNIPFRPGEPMNVSFELESCRSKLSYQYREGVLTIAIDLVLELNLVELLVQEISVNREIQDYLEERAATVLGEEILRLTQKTVQGPNGDIFGFGNRMYKKQPDLWAALREDWDNILKDARWDINVEAHILNTGVTSRQ